MLLGQLGGVDLIKRMSFLDHSQYAVYWLFKTASTLMQAILTDVGPRLPKNLAEWVFLIQGHF